jgi:hypothetical protein
MFIAAPAELQPVPTQQVHSRVHVTLDTLVLVLFATMLLSVSSVIFTTAQAGLQLAPTPWALFCVPAMSVSLEMV